MKYFYVPKRFDPKVLFPEMERHYQKYYYVLHKLFEIPLHNRTMNEDSFIPLHSKHLEKILNTRWCTKIMGDLLGKEVIFSDNHYIVGSKAKGYKISKYYKSGGTNRIPIEKSMYKNIEQNKENRIDFSKMTNALHVALAKKLLDIEIDAVGACKYINLEMKKEEDVVTYMYFVDSILNKDFRFIVDETVGRVHTNISNFPSKLRRFLRYKGNPLVNIDIRNSQPFIFNKIIISFISEFIQKRSLSHTLEIEQELSDYLIKNLKIDIRMDLFSLQNVLPLIISTKSNKPVKTTNIYNIHSLRHFLYFASYPIYINSIRSNFYYLSQFCNKQYLGDISSYVLTFDDAEKYVELTKEGKFHDYFMEKMGINDRSTYKETFFKQVFFSKLNYNYIYKNRRAFHKYFPTVSTLIDLLKLLDYKFPSLLLQRAESQIMINNISKRIINELPQCYFLTIHDSILTLPEYENEVSAIILEEFSIKYGLTPTLKVD